VQFTKPFKQKISQGAVTTSFRTWRRPQARVGGQYNIPPFGSIEVTSVARVSARSISRAQARKAGFDDVDSMLGYLKARPADELYRVDFRYLGASAVKVPDRARRKLSDLEALEERLQKTDARSSRGPWAFATLQLIATRPGVRAPDLAESLGFETAPFKANVRKLKALGLTESLEVGYRLSPLGKQLVSWLRRKPARRSPR
jgi:hypothetical protein